MSKPYMHLPPGATRHPVPMRRTLTRVEELPSAPCYFMLIYGERSRFVPVIPCTRAQAQELLAEVEEWIRASWLPGVRYRLRVVYDRPVLSPRRRYEVTTAHELLYNWRHRG